MVTKCHGVLINKTDINSYLFYQTKSVTSTGYCGEFRSWVKSPTSRVGLTTFFAIFINRASHMGFWTYFYKLFFCFCYSKVFPTLIVRSCQKLVKRHQKINAVIKAQKFMRSCFVLHHLFTSGSLPEFRPISERSVDVRQTLGLS